MKHAAIGLALSVLVACGGEATTTPTETTEAFCNQALPILSDNDVGGEPGGLLAQMEDLTQASELLTDETRTSLVALIDDLTGQLHLAEEGRAQNGWSSVAVVDFVASICGPGEMISWVVQP